jgi:DNA-directed RNA polymerase specialized sigma24 family protein
MDKQTLSDEALLASTPEDPDAFAMFYRRHAPGLLGYLVGRLGDAELAADVCAETFAAALVGVGRYDPKSAQPVNWLYGIAWHIGTSSSMRSEEASPRIVHDDGWESLGLSTAMKRLSASRRWRM